MMNLEIISEEFTNRIINFATLLSKEGINVRQHMLSYKKKVKLPLYLDKNMTGVQIFEYQVNSSRFPLIKRKKLYKNLLKRLQPVIENSSPLDTIYFISSPSTLLLPILKTLAKSFCTILDIRDIYQEWDYHPFLKWKLERWEQLSTMKKVHKVTYSHPAFIKYFLKDGVAKDKLVCINNGANSDVFSFQGDRVVLSRKKLNLVYAGGIDRYHNVLLWIDVMKHLKNDDVHLTIVGSGNAANEIQQSIHEYQLNNVTFINKGFLLQKDLAKHFRSADYSLSSLNENRKVYHEVVITTKAYESLSCGTPVISAGGNGMAKFVKEFPPSINIDISSGANSKSIANAIRKLEILDDKMHEDIAKQFQSKYSFQILSKNLMKVLEKSLEDFNRGGK